MKIHSDHLAAVQKELESKQKTAEEKGNFQELLKGELSKSEKSTPEGSKMTGGPQSRIQGLEYALRIQSGQDPKRKNEQAVMDRINTVLTRWDEYTSTLKSRQTDLRKADQLLDDIEVEIQQIKDALGKNQPEAETNPLLKELEILAVTERVKFNRGDYI